jgi:hypothetical protein
MNYQILLYEVQDRDTIVRWCAEVINHGETQFQCIESKITDALSGLSDLLETDSQIRRETSNNVGSGD